ncbi:MAG: hypothetical protein WC644_04375 [Ignavibacteria bacterium]|jgi:hypothetical protein
MKKRWILGKFKTIKLKLYDEKLKRYQAYLKYKYPKGRTMQEDLENYITNLFK